MLTSVLSTLLVPETKGKTLEDLSNEPQENFVRGTTAHPHATHNETGP
jgi:PHS family inorganic phosphate transporter-like MFS transporter